MYGWFTSNRGFSFLLDSCSVPEAFGLAMGLRCCVAFLIARPQSLARIAGEAVVCKIQSLPRQLRVQLAPRSIAFQFRPAYMYLDVNRFHSVGSYLTYILVRSDRCHQGAGTREAFAIG